jgi:pimeloyl-ACP methyl ester carboxylesterase
MGKSILFLLAGISLIALNSSPVSGQANTGWTASKETEDRLSKNQPGFNFYEAKVPVYYLPDVLTTLSVKKISSAAAWKKTRRPEVLEMLRTNVFGKVPATPYEKTFSVITFDTAAMDSKATLKQVDILISAEGKSLTIHLTLFTPNQKTGPVPVFLLIDNRGPANTDPMRKVKSEFWPAEEVLARGYGIAVFSNSDVDPDKFDDFQNGIHGILDKGKRGDDSWGTLAAWAWGASRCLDYLVTDKDVNKDRVAVVGHSRGGKTALWAGAEDQRFGMVIANESGCGGAALARRKLGETVARINTSFPHWFCLNYRKYNDKETSMPFDMHMLLALTAPRPLYIDAAAEDLWGDPKGCYLALYHSLPVYNLFDRKVQLSSLVPPLNTQVVSGNMGFHIRDGEHNMKLQDWNFFMDFADKVWGKS